MKPTRFKGLAEMNAQELWETTMNPDTRTLLKVEMEDAAVAEEVFVDPDGRRRGRSQVVHPAQRQRRPLPGHLSHDRQNPPTERRAIGTIEITDEMEQSLRRLRDVGHRLPGPARRPRRPQAGAASDHLLDVREQHHRRLGPSQVRQGGRRRHGELPPPRRHGHLRRPGPDGPGLLAAPSPHRPAGQLRHASTTRRAPPALHRVRGSPSCPCTCSRGSGRTPSTSRTTTRARLQQPTVLPARFPNLLVNGCQGIAVGMATNIPPHNLGRGHRRLHSMSSTTPMPTTEELLRFVKGPDFPTGGFIVGTAGIRDALTTGPGLGQDASGGRRRRRSARAAPPSSSPRCHTRCRSSGSWPRSRSLVDDKRSRGHRRRSQRVLRPRRHPARHRAEEAAPSPRSSSTSCSRTPRYRTPSGTTWWRWSTGFPAPSIWPR